MRAAALAQERTELAGLWAGQAASLVRHRKAAELFSDLVAQTEAILSARNG